MRIGPINLSAGQQKSFQFDHQLPYIRIDNPTNARVFFPDIKVSVGPYTLGVVIPWRLQMGSSTVDASDVSYPIATGVFVGATISFSITDEETGTSPGATYSPISTITGQTINAVITGGSVVISNTVNATITNATLAVTQSGIWNVTISNATINVTGSVSITSGSVSITNASISIVNAVGTKITSSRPVTQAYVSTAAVSNTAVGNFNLTSDMQALLIVLPNNFDRYVHLKLEWISGGGSQVPTPPLELFSFNQSYYVVPISGVGVIDGSQVAITSLRATIQASAVGPATVQVIAIYEGAPLWMQFFAPPFLAPNQLPKPVYLTLANNVAQWVIAPVTNVRITVFSLTMLYFNPGTGGISWLVGHNTALPAPNSMPINAETYLQGYLVNDRFEYSLHGAQLPRGEGLYASQLMGVPQNWGALLIYSLD